MTSTAVAPLSGAGTSVTALVDVIELEPQGAADRGVHLVHAGHVRQLENLVVAELRRSAANRASGTRPPSSTRQSV